MNTDNTTTATQPNYTILRPTKVYNRDGWTAETYINANGYTWQLLTTRGRNKQVSTYVTTCKVSTSNSGTSIDMGMLMGKPVNQDFKILQAGEYPRLTEAIISEIHLLAFVEFQRKLTAGQLAVAPKEIGIGQVLFTEHPMDRENRRAIYSVIGDGSYKTVYLDGSRTSQDDHIRPYSDKFGIGVYYNEGDIITQDEIDVLLQKAYANMEIEAEQEQIKLQEQENKNAERKAYLAQFTRADKRTTSNMLKAYILREHPTVSKVSIKSDSFSGVDSINITYLAPEPIEAIEAMKYKLRYGSFDGMTDMYNYDGENEALIIDGYIMETYKYASIYFEKSDEQRVINTTPAPTNSTAPNSSNNGVNVTLMSDKGGIEIKFAAKPDGGILDKLKSLGFRWSRFNGVWWANQSTDRKLYAMQLGGITE
jgi:hypothetical protein